MIHTRPGDTIAQCPSCGSGNVIMENRTEPEYAHRFNCRACHLVTPWRPLRSQAADDVEWVSLAAAWPCRLAEEAQCPA